ncbi:hypothetical protein MUG84_18000 [Paenibacillus sp. KQZ6P-2]|uniref:Polymer-forming cytoskeletal protein n=1 Tax=Paenibacillus mangrovi TaxID=2931978 RepID=A0A9X2B449_9BACL|nr:hypothetical protein [Paenibacillus mangrovi]MCJ8013620.1 hypothetical protein [Paenibacillus mangrovi]
MRKLLYTVFCFLLMMILIPGIASAKSIFEHQNTTVPVGQTVNDVYVVGGDAEVSGNVTGIVVVINGNLHLGSKAVVNGVVVVIGGDVKQDPGAVLGDDIYNFSLDNATQNSLLIGGGLMLGLRLLQLVGSLLLILIPVLIRVMGRQKIATFIDQYHHVSMGRLLFAGFLSGLVITALCTLLLISVIGIPILIPILLMIVGAVTLGITIVSSRLGGMFNVPVQKSEWMKVTIGAVILTGLVNIPFVGWIVLTLLILISFGISTQWLVGKLQKKPRA